MNENEIVIYTDGGCSGNPGPGGWANVILAENQEFPQSGGESLTTNNRMELTAVIQAFSAILSKPEWACRQITVCTDSQYVKNGMTSWLEGWKRRNWVSSTKAPVKNKDLWQRLDKECSRHKITFKWVKGHAGHAENERCDELARTAALGDNKILDEGFCS